MRRIDCPKSGCREYSSCHIVLYLPFGTLEYHQYAGFPFWDVVGVVVFFIVAPCFASQRSSAASKFFSSLKLLELSAFLFKTCWLWLLSSVVVFALISPNCPSGYEVFSCPYCNKMDYKLISLKIKYFKTEQANKHSFFS